MLNTVIKALAYIVIIVLAFVFKKLGILKREDSMTVSKLVTKFTLPCAVVNAFSANDTALEYIILPLVSLFMNFAVAFIALLFERKDKEDSRALYFLCSSGYNIGSFAMPFVSGFLDAEAIVASCMFDAGNALGCCGGTYTIIKGMTDPENRVDLKSTLKRLFSSVPFDAYLFMFLFSICGFKMPGSVLSLTSVVGAANPFLAMLLVGLLIDIRLKKGDMKKIVKIILIKYAFAMLLAAAFYFLTPFPVTVKQGLMLVTFAPVPSLAPYFTEDCSGEHMGELASLCSSISFVISIPIMVGLLILFS